MDFRAVERSTLSKTTAAFLMMLLLARYLGLAVEAPTGGDSFGDSDDDDDSCERLSTRSSNDINSGNKCSEKPELQQQQLADEVCWMKTNKCIMQLLQKI